MIYYFALIYGRLAPTGVYEYLKEQWGPEFTCAPPNLRAWEVCQASCRCGKVVGAGKQASRDMILKRCEIEAERVNKVLLNRYSFRVEGDLTTLRAKMAGVLAALQNIDISVSAALGTDSQGVLTEL